MAFCANCGAQTAEGDKFCGNCGTMLSSGNSAPQNNYQQNVQVNFESQQAPNFDANFSQQQFVPQSPSKYVIAMEELGKELSIFFKNPITSITKSKFQMSSLSTYIFAGIMALILILLNFWTAAQNFALASSGKGKVTITINSTKKVIQDLSGILLGSNEIYEIGYGKLFLASFFFVIFMLVALWALTLLVNHVMLKGQLNAIQAINVVAFTAIPYAIISFISIILGYVEPNLSYMVYLAGITTSTVLLYKAISSNINKPEISALYSFTIIPVLLYLVNFLFFKAAGVIISVFYRGIFMGIF
ncbi:MAG: zinc ribbon domain-containing protein [Clostridiales bacterium]|uniref:zinc ribbon domain-containing protein n=1 Tax=Clostridium sp. N3C TaxID=1776758 RepID=UPI00092E1550|nr:zinc ribbon domain-containing protein [Clostridium sp. N3C]NLZ47532.1 zinc ribbon domain-containing protein [Clostridiales bacterium]SCN25727.1 putative membrane protein [Clostridium sp. N3C]